MSAYIPEDAPDLQPREKEAVDKKAEQAGEEAQRKLALDLMPFQRLLPRARMVAAWLSTLDDLRKFHERYIDTKRTPYAHGSLYIFKVLESSTAGAMNAKDVRTFEAFVENLARIFCGYTDSDEIHELIEMRWGIIAPSLVDPSSDTSLTDTASYVHNRSRWNKALGSLPSSLTKGRGAFNKEDLALTVVTNLGKHTRELTEAYQKAYDEVYDKEEARIRSDRKRNQNLNRSRERAEARGRTTSGPTSDSLLRKFSRLRHR